jgi:ubiquitin-protein ligase
MRSHIVEDLTDSLSQLTLRQPTYTDVDIITDGHAQKQSNILSLLQEKLSMPINPLHMLMYLAGRNRLNTEKMFGYQEAVNMNLKTFQKVLMQVKECNEQFETLRTVIHPDPEEHINLFYFVMLPNDGALANQPLIGRMIIPVGYPQDPPVLHLFTKTSRYNVDVFHGRTNLSSSMCFDILKRSLKQGDGGWKSTYNIGCLFASLMVSVVSIKVPQQYGDDQIEYVSMEKLAQTKIDVQRAYSMYKHVIPPIPRLRRVYGRSVPAYDLDMGDIKVLKEEQIVKSRPFRLQSKSKEDQVTTCIDLTNLTSNMVFSVVMTTDATDLVGTYRDTVLVRNGVTGTAAKKIRSGKTLWYYHGTPMNTGENLLQITIAQDQMTMCLIDRTSAADVKNMKRIVHGDVPVSFLTKYQLGDVRGREFRLCIYVKVKGKVILQTALKTIPMKTGFIF